MIKILFLGKTREKFISLGIEEYVKRLKKFVKLEIVEVKSLENYNFKDDLIVIFDLNGKNFSSEDLARFFKENNQDITIVLGDQNGIPNSIKEKANLTISISRMTFTHELARLIILEQVYRAYTIINNLKYHK